MSHEPEGGPMSHESTWPQIRDALRAMFPRVEGRPCVYVSRYTRRVFACRRVHGLRVEAVAGEGDSVAGWADWVDPPEGRLDYLTDEFLIGFDCLEVGPRCWYDRYFQAWFVFDPEMVARSEGGDHAWVGAYLGLDKTPCPTWAGDFPWRPPGYDGPISYRTPS
jgi:hypothetical protein